MAALMARSSTPLPPISRRASTDPASARAAQSELRAVDTQMPQSMPSAGAVGPRATGQGVAIAAEPSPFFDGVATRAHSPAIAEPAAETAPHPVDALRTNVRGLAADLTLAGVGVGRTAARLLQRAAAAPVGRRAAELADAWTGGAAQAWTARARGWAEGATRRAMAFHERMAGPSAADHLERLTQSGGAPLTAELRARMEALFGHRLAHARIHTDASAAQAAEAAAARAVTMGSHIYFASGQFAPGTTSGDRLLVHELTHVVQHDRGQLGPPAGPGVELSSPSDPAEHEARAMEDRAVEAHAPEAADAAGAQPVEAPMAPRTGSAIASTTSRTGPRTRSRGSSRRSRPASSR
jgi:hypothetical protein